MNKELCSICNKRYSLYTKSNKSYCVSCFQKQYYSNSFSEKPDENLKVLSELEKIKLEMSEDAKKDTPNLNITTSDNAISKTNKTKTPLLDKFGTEYVARAKEKKFSITYGRVKEVERLIRSLSRKTKNNPVLIGEPGVGKTAIVELLSTKIANQEVPSNLLNKKIYSVNVSDLLAGTKYRGEFEQRMSNLIKELESNDDVILFVDEIHTINANGTESSPSIGQMLKPSMARGDIQIIGATTLDEYRVHIEKDGALDRRFQTIKVEEPSMDDTFLILQAIKNDLENHHNVKITEAALRSSISLTQRYVSNKKFPDKAIDILDEACSYTRLNSNGNTMKKVILSNQIAANRINSTTINDFSLKDLKVKLENKNRAEQQLELLSNDSERESLIVDDETIAAVLTEKTNIPISKNNASDIAHLKTIEEFLSERVKGQSNAIRKISEHTKVVRMNLKNKNKPNGVFLFLGPTGVGKTELAKAYTEFILGDADKLVRIDMSEMMEKHSVSKLIGTSPGYAGYNDGGKLTNILRHNPYSVILLDEVEKAHPDVFNLLLQVFDEGRITDGKGNLIDARNAVFIMTSNLGSEFYFNKNKGLGFDSPAQGTNQFEDSLEEQVMSKVKKYFKPEFLNRLDLSVTFKILNDESVKEITSNLLFELKIQLKDLGIDLTYTDDLIRYIAKEGYTKELGARPLQRKVTELKHLLANNMISNSETKKIEITISNENEIIIS